MPPLVFLALRLPKAQKQVPGRNFELFLAIETKISPPKSVSMLFQATKKQNFWPKPRKEIGQF